MDKIFQILAVFVMMMLVISRFIKGREPRYHPFDYIRRFRPPLPAGVEERLKSAIVGMPAEYSAGAVDVFARVDMFVEDEALLFCYSAEGKLTIFRREGDKYRQKQELPVPLDCAAMALDPAEQKLYFEAGEFIFVYG